MTVMIAFKPAATVSTNPFMSRQARPFVLCFVLAMLFSTWPGITPQVKAEGMLAGAARIDVSSDEHGPVNGRLHARALVIRKDDLTVALVTLDVVSLGEIGYIPNDFLDNVRTRIQQELGIPPAHVIINCSHCHGVPCKDVEDRTVAVIKQAAGKLVEVQIGVGRGKEDRIQENRRLILEDGRQIDVRRAYSLPPDAKVASVGPIDPDVGILRLDSLDGTNIAVVYNFACHPIQGVPDTTNTADMTGFSSEVIEDNLSDGAVALFVQGCGGDINSISYKDVHHPHDGEPLGNMLGLSTLKAARKVKMKVDDRLAVINQVLELPRLNVAERIISLETQRDALVTKLGSTYLNFDTFMQLSVKFKLSGEFPSYNSYRYLHERAMGRQGIERLDAQNRSHLAAYIRNIHTMEQLTRLQTNLRLLNRHQQRSLDAVKRTLDVELVGLRVGDFVLTTFPGELTVQIGLNIKKASPHKLTFVAGYTNGYIYYAPTTKQLLNTDAAQEDSDCMLAPHWQKIYEDKVAEILKDL